MENATQALAAKESLGSGEIEDKDSRFVARMYTSDS